MTSTRTCLLLLCSLAVCSAACGNGKGRIDPRLNGLEPFLQTLMHGDRVTSTAAAVGREETFRRYAEGPAYLTIKFNVPPHEYDNFVKEWSFLEKICAKEQGNVIFDLKKTVTDNVVFLAYSEWESQIDLFYHTVSDHFLDFVDFVIKHNIGYEQVPIRPVTDTKQERRATYTGAELAGKKSDTASEEVHFLTRVFLKPSAAEDFIDAWKDTASETYKEDGNAVYALRRVAMKSNEFYIYGTWDSYTDLNKHMTSKHVKSLLDFAVDHDIVILRVPLVPYDEALLGAVSV